MIDGKAKINFGTGDILITPMTNKESNKGCLILQNKGTHVVGEYSSTEQFEGDAENDTLITFSCTKSIDVVIERLQKLKDMMNGNLDDCREYGEYEF